MAETSPKTRWNRITSFIFTVILVLPLIYFLSVGPAVLLVVKFPSIRTPVRSIYAPMIWIHDNTRLKKTIDLYLGFWSRAAHKL